MPAHTGWFRRPQALMTSVVILSWLLSTLACSGEFLYPVELTATAAAPKTAIASINLEPAVTLTPFDSGAAAAPVDPLPSTPTPLMIEFNNPLATFTPEGPIPTETVPALPIAPSATPASNLPIVLDPSAIAPTATSRPTNNEAPLMYYTQAGDTLASLSARFNVQPDEITSPARIPQDGLFDPGILLLIPPRLDEVSSSKQLFPDSEVVYSPSALDLDIEKFVKEAGGYLSTYKEWRTNGWHTGAQVVRRVATENSTNPRLLMAILEQQSHWVYGQPNNLAETDFPIGWLHFENEKKGLYFQLSWAVHQLNVGYYGWRDGTVTQLTFPNGEILRLAPDLNAGTVAVLYMFSRLYDQPQWAGLLYGPEGLLPLYEKMFDNPYLRAQSVEPLFPATLTQPPLELPFLPGKTWSMTGGPHSAWQTTPSDATGARAALDFAPSTTTHGCYESEEYVTAMSSGLVVRAENGVVVVDMDGDGYEQTGWNILYLHIATKDRIVPGTFVTLNDTLGHPSCEGGTSNGTHVHVARKYNGEWILADGPMPFVLSGWRAHSDKVPYMGTLTKDGKTVTASQYGSFESLVTRPKTTP